MNAHGERTGGFCAEMDAIDRWWALGKPGLDALPGEWERGFARTELEKSMKPCPFCGATVESNIHIYAEEVWRGNGWRVKCYGCDAAGPTELTHAEAIKAWNKPVRMGG